MNRIYLYIIFVIPIISKSQSMQYEQIAFDYFYHTVLLENPPVRSIEFNGASEERYSFFDLVVCFDEPNIKVGLEPKEINNPNSVDIILPNPAKIKFKPLSNSKRLKVYVFLSIQIDNKFYVRIDLYKKREYVVHYLIEIDEHGSVRICNTTEII